MYSSAIEYTSCTLHCKVLCLTAGFLQQSRSVASFVNDGDAAQPVYWVSAAQSIPYRLPFRVGFNAVEYKDLVSCIVVSTPARFRHNCNQESRGQCQLANELSLRCGFASHYFL